MITYYINLKKTGETQVTNLDKTVSTVPVFASDSVGKVIVSVYQGDQKDPNDVLIANLTNPFPIYENFIGKDMKDWVLKGNKIVPSEVKVKENTVTDIELEYQNSLKKGITVNDITLAAQDADQNAFTKLLTLLQTAEGLQADTTAFKASPQSIADINGKVHTMSVTELRILIVQYGMAINALWVDRTNKIASL